MRGVTSNVELWEIKTGISTHTPHARRDVGAHKYVICAKISTHTPHARRDELQFEYVKSHCTFQLTRLMRGVTAACRRVVVKAIISTHTPHARRDIATTISPKGDK